MIHSKKKITLLLTTIVCFISLLASKHTSVPHQNTNAPELLPADSFQILIDAYTHFKNPEKKKNEFQKLLTKLRNHASKINGSKTVVFRNTKYNLFVANLDSDEIRMHLFNPNDNNKNFRNLGAVKQYLQEQKQQPLMITNAGMFTSDFEPEGLYIEATSKTFFDLDTGKATPNANFYLKPNGVFYLDEKNIPHIDTTEKLQRLNKTELQKLKLATQSGPMLVINGSIHKAFIQGSKNLKIRSGVGLIKGNNKKVVFAITLDESNFYDFALFFRDVFNCDNALFLDGAISQMYLHDINPEEIGGIFGPMISASRKQRM